LAANKMYFQPFAEEVRPATLVTRDRDAIEHLAKEYDGDVAIKPLQGSGRRRPLVARKGGLGKARTLRLGQRSLDNVDLATL
jgi:hypothetical protein